MEDGSKDIPLTYQDRLVPMNMCNLTANITEISLSKKARTLLKESEHRYFLK